jgi:mycoredoxin
MSSTEAGGPTPVTLYWRPGCRFCASLRRELARIGLATREVNIWDDARAASVVRSVARGNETVPTVIVGDRALVNPTAAQVVEAVRSIDPELVADLPEPRPPGLVLRLMTKLLGGGG